MTIGSSRAKTVWLIISDDASSTATSGVVQYTQTKKALCTWSGCHWRSCAGTSGWSRSWTRRSGCGNEMTQSLSRMRSEMKTCNKHAHIDTHTACALNIHGIKSCSLPTTLAPDYPLARLQFWVKGVNNYQMGYSDIYWPCTMIVMRWLFV